MSDQKTINVKDLWGLKTKISTRDGSFIITVQNAKLKVNLHFDRPWLRYLAHDLWKIIKSEERQVADIRAAMDENDGE